MGWRLVSDEEEEDIIPLESLGAQVAYGTEPDPGLINPLIKFRGLGEYEKPKGIYVAGVGKDREPLGMVERGNIDLVDRPIVKNPDGTVSTELSFSIEEDGEQVIIPHIVDGIVLNDEQAIAYYKQSGEHLGKFKDRESATSYAQTLNQWQRLGHPTGFVERKAAEAAEVSPIQKENLGMVERGNIPAANPFDLEPIFLTHTEKGDKNYGKTFVIPTVIDGKQFSTSAAIRDFKKTGKHLGIFNSEVEAVGYLDKLGPAIQEAMPPNSAPQSLAPQSSYFATEEEEQRNEGRGPNYPAEPLDIPIRKQLHPGEDKYFREHPEVGGMAAEDDKVILNPYSPPEVNKEAVAKNEAFRLKLRKEKVDPDFDLTKEQRNLPWVKDSRYEGDEKALKATIAARIYSGDPSAAATKEQLEWVRNYAGEKFVPPGLTPRQAAGAANRKELSDAIAKIEEDGYPVPHFIGTPDEPEGDRAPTKDMEKLVEALKLKEEDTLGDGDKEKAAQIAKEREYWENKIKTEGMSAEQWKKQTGEEDPRYPHETAPPRFREVTEEEPTASTGFRALHDVGIVTAYRPGGDASMGLSPTVEGGNVDAHGEPILGRTTVEDYLAGNGDYVTVAMDKNSSWQNQFLRSSSFPGLVFRVRDNGGYGNNKTGENWVDIAFSDPQKAKSMLLRGVPFTPISVDEAQQISASRPNLTREPRLQALYVPGGSFKYEEQAPEGGPPDPFIEFTARTARGAERGTREMFGGAISLTEAATRGERNVYLDEEEPEEEAKSDIPMLEEQIATLQKQLKDQTLKEDPQSAQWVNDTIFDSPEIQKLDKQLKQARLAAAGDLRENVIGTISRQTERLAREAEANQAAAMKKYAPYISQARDTKWGFQLADALGTTVPGVLTSIGNPIFGAATIYAQIYQASQQQYMAEKPEATREEAQKFANDQALAQTPWAIAGNQLTARALKSAFAQLPAGAIERGSRFFGTQLGMVLKKNAEAFIGNVGSAVGASVMGDMVSEDYDLLEDTSLGEKFVRSMEPASIAGGVSAIFGVGGLGVAAARRPAGVKPKAEAAPKERPTEEVTVGPKGLPAPAPEEAVPPKAPEEKPWAPTKAPEDPINKALVKELQGKSKRQVEAMLLHTKEEQAKRAAFLNDKVSVELKAKKEGMSTAAMRKLLMDNYRLNMESQRILQERFDSMPDEPSPNIAFKDISESEPEKAKPAPATKPAGHLNLDKPAIDQDFGPEWKSEVSTAYEAIKTGKSYITEVTGTDMFMHFAKDFPGENWRADTANFMRRHFGIEGAKFTRDGKEHTVHFKEKPPEKFSREEGELALAIPRPPPIPGAPRPPAGALPPSTSIVPSVPPGHIVSIAPLLQNPFMRRHINYAPGQREHFGEPRSPVRAWQRFFIGTAEVFERTLGLEHLGKAIRGYVDDRAMFKGRDHEPFRQWEKTVNAQEKAQAHDEFYRFFLQANDPDVNVQKQAIPTYWAAGAKGRELIDITRDYLNRSGDENLAMGIVVFDPATGKFRPAKKVAGGGDPIPPAWYPGWKPGYFPRMIAKNEMDIIRDPVNSPAAYEALKDKIEAMGFPRDSIDDHLSTLRQHATSNEFFASLDLARTAKLPQTSFDYSFETVRRYMSARAERLAQIKNFGQVKAFQGPESLTLFDRTLKDVPMDDYTRNYIEGVRNTILNIQTAQDPVSRFSNQLGTVLTGIHLGNPITASRNLLGGQATTAAVYGIKHYMKGVEDAFNNIDSAYEKGIIIDDLSNLMEQSESLGGTQKFTNLLLKYSGEQPAENLNRLINMGAAKSMLRDAIEEYRRDPFSKRSLQYFGHFKRMGGIDPQALLDEGGSGPLTDRYLRQSVRYVQGGYQIDQTPAFQNTDKARFWFKYSKWGTQHMDLFNKEVVRPAIRELTAGKYAKETVEVRDPATGRMVTKEVPGSVSKAVGYFTLFAAAGMGAAAFARYAFGIEDRTESWTEIIHKLDKNGQEAFFDILAKIFQYQLTMGVGGYLSNVAQYGFDWTQKVRMKDPLNPPGLELVRDTAQLLNDSMVHGPRWRDFDEYLRRNSSQYRSAKQAAAYFGNDVFPLGFHELKRESMLQDLKWLRSVTRRYEKEYNITAASPWRPGAGTKTEMTRFNYDLKEALLMGDIPGAKKLVADRFRGKTPKEQKILMESMMDSVRAGRPIKIGGSTSEAAITGFLQWSDANMSKADSAKLRRMDKTYTETAIAAGILKPGKPNKKAPDIEEWLEGQQARTKLRETR